MGKLQFFSCHNVRACFSKIEEHSTFHPVIDFLQRSPIALALDADPTIHERHIVDFWSSAQVQNDGIHATVAGQQIIITQLMISNTFKLDDLDGVQEYSEKRNKLCLGKMGYNQEPIEKQFKKKVFHPEWRYIAHVILKCMSGRRRTFDELNQRLASMMVALVFRLEFSYSAYIYDELSKHIQNAKSKFLLYPRFLQYIFDENFPGLVREGNHLSLSNLSVKIFSNMKSKPGTGVNVPLFPHIVNKDEVVVLPQSPAVDEEDNQPPSSSDPQEDTNAPADPNITGESRRSHSSSRFISMSQDELISHILTQETSLNKLENDHAVLQSANSELQSENTKLKAELALKDDANKKLLIDAFVQKDILNKLTNDHVVLQAANDDVTTAYLALMVDTTVLKAANGDLKSACVSLKAKLALKDDATKKGEKVLIDEPIAVQDEVQISNICDQEPKSPEKPMPMEKPKYDDYSNKPEPGFVNNLQLMVGQPPISESSSRKRTSREDDEANKEVANVANVKRKLIGQRSCGTKPSPLAQSSVQTSSSQPETCAPQPSSSKPSNIPFHIHSSAPSPLAGSKATVGVSPLFTVLPLIVFLVNHA